MEVIAIVRRQQLFNFIIDIAGLLTSNIIPLLLVLPPYSLRFPSAR